MKRERERRRLTADSADASTARGLSERGAKNVDCGDGEAPGLFSFAQTSKVAGQRDLLDVRRIGDACSQSIPSTPSTCR